MKRKFTRKKHIKQSIIISIVIIIFAVILVGWINRKNISETFNKKIANFTIQFDRFLGDSQVEKKEEKIIVGLNLDTDDIFTYKDIISYKTGIDNLYQIIGNKEYYDKYKNSLKKYNKDLQPYITNNYYNKIVENKEESLLFENAKHIFESEFMEYKQTNIIRIGKNQEYTILDVEVISVGDTMSFYVENLRLYLDKYNRIDKIDKIGDWQEVVNTQTPLTENSILYQDHKYFQKAWNTLISELKNKNLYEEYLKGQNSNIEYKLNTLAENINLENKDIQILKELFLLGKGTFENYGVESYYFSDKEMIPISTYNIEFSEASIVITYNRLSNQIESISIKK